MDINISNMEDYQKRMLDEHSELKDRLTKLNAALGKDDNFLKESRNSGTDLKLED